jgi:hypothetical protein
MRSMRVSFGALNLHLTWSLSFLRVHSRTYTCMHLWLIDTGRNIMVCAIDADCANCLQWQGNGSTTWSRCLRRILSLIPADSQGNTLSCRSERFARDITIVLLYIYSNSFNEFKVALQGNLCVHSWKVNQRKYSNIALQNTDVIQMRL